MPDPILQEIKDRLNLADVIAGYIQVKKSGVNFKAVCPFHNEKTPSLVISPQKQVWHCFGCGEGGDVFGFVIRYENVDFKEALKLLAEKAGVKLPEYRPRDKHEVDEEELVYRINDFAARLYQQILLQDKRGMQALEYLKNRGLSPQTIKQWQIGFAPDDFHFLENALAQKKVSSQELVKAGVSSKNERGQVYDRFRNRITFPIFDYMGKTVGFSARILVNDDKSAKYINSPETLIYSKSKILFGLNFAKNEIRKKDEAIIVEGQMDCISAHQAGFGNVVASSGTALTQQQLTLLGKLTKNLKFCFDADAAGHNATKRAVEQYLGQDFNIKIIDLGQAKDPDELIKKDPKLFAEKVQQAQLFLDYYMQRAFVDYSELSIERKKHIAKEILPMLKFLTDPLEQDHYIQLLAKKFNTLPKILWDTLQKINSPQPARVAQVPTPRAKGPAGTLALEKQVLGGALVYPEFFEEIKNQLTALDFSDSEIRDLWQVIASPGSLGTQAVKDSAVAKEATFMVESQLDEAEGNKSAVWRELTKAWVQLKVIAIKKQQQQLEAKIKRAESEKNKAKIEELNHEFAQISAERGRFEALL